MTLTKLILALACLMPGALIAQEGKVTELIPGCNGPENCAVQLADSILYECHPN
jgi:hypothetical protein